MNCQFCYQPLLRLTCDECSGLGYYFARDEVGDTPVECPTCHGAGEEYPCMNTDCPGIVWYPLSRRESATLRTVIASIEREESK